MQAEAVKNQNETNSIKQSVSSKDEEINALKEEMNGMTMKCKELEREIDGTQEMERMSRSLVQELCALHQQNVSLKARAVELQEETAAATSSKQALIDYLKDRMNALNEIQI